MFNKLISNLPFNPSLLNQVAFYSKRLRQEDSIRRIGLGFVALTMLIQLFAVFAPPQKSLAYSNDYIINGLRTRDDILRAWDAPGSDLNSVYGRFGLNRNDIVALPMLPNDIIRSTNADYWTIGRNSLGGYPSVAQQFKAAEIPVNTGPSTVYLRQLHAWDIKNPYNSYAAFKGYKNGHDFWILVDCGNYTQIGKPPLGVPGLDLHKTLNGGPRTIKAGETFSYHFEFRNPNPDSQPAEGVYVDDGLNLGLYDVISKPTPWTTLDGSLMVIHMTAPVVYTPYMQSAGDLVLRAKSDLPNGTTICNAATIKASNVFSVSTPNSCLSVLNPCPIDSSISSTDVGCTNPTLACSLTDSNVNLTTREVTLKTVVSSTNPSQTSVLSYHYDFGDSSGDKVVASSLLTDNIKHTYVTGKYHATVIVAYTTGKTTKTSGSVTCAADIELSPDKPLGQNKSVKNVTQNLTGDAALKAKAKANDVLEYSLITHNSFNYDRANYTVKDNIADLLEYAELDESFLTSHGGKYDAKTKTVTWANVTVKANSDDTKLFRIKMKNVIPATNQPSAMTTSFDCTISNKYGNEVSVGVACPPAKQAEYISTKLPNTGPGTSLAIGFVATSIIAYFFARNRLMARELELIKVEYSSGGGF